MKVITSKASHCYETTFEFFFRNQVDGQRVEGLLTDEVLGHLDRLGRRLSVFNFETLSIFLRACRAFSYLIGQPASSLKMKFTEKYTFDRRVKSSFCRV